MSEIQLKNVCKRFPDGAVGVENANLEIADGEFIILVGPSGCGKSTTLNMIAGLEDISEGDLLIGGRRMNDVAPKDRDIAMVFQSYALYPHMTVRENIAFPLKLAKMDRAEIDEKVEEAARTLDLVEHLDRKPANLSGGQRQRVAMGRAIVRRPKVFLMDEPLSNLDARLRVQMRTEIARLQRRLGVTTVYVTHDQTEAMTLGDRVVVLKDGRIQQVGAPRELYEHPVNLFVAGFIGSPSMNVLRGAVHGDVVSTALGEIPLPDAVRGRLAAAGADGGAGGDAQPGEVLVGLRPEAFEDARLVDAGDDARGRHVTVEVDVLESMGADSYAYLSLPPGPDGLDSADDAAAVRDAGLEEHGVGDMVARISAESEIRRGERAELWFDATRASFFDVRTGENLGLRR